MPLKSFMQALMHDINDPNGTIRRHAIRIAALVVIALVFVRLAFFNMDPSAFILASKKLVVQSELHNDLKLLDSGYDGMYFYRYAVAPFSKDQRYGLRRGDAGIIVDNPVYRRGRVVYPMAAWLMALGQPKAIPWTLIGVNILAFILLVFIVNQIAHHQQWPGYVAIIPLLISGLWMSLARDLSDLLAVTLLAWAYWEWIRQRQAWFLLASTLLLLCREVSVLMLFPAYVILTSHSLKKRRFRDLPMLAIPWMILAGWTFFLRSQYSSGSDHFNTRFWNHFRLPFQGMLEGVQSNLYVTHLLGLFWHFVIIGIGFIVMWRNRRNLQLTWMTVAFPLNALLFTLYGKPIYEDLWSYMRVLAPTVLMTFFFILEQEKRLPLWIVGLSAMVASSCVFLISHMI